MQIHVDRPHFVWLECFVPFCCGRNSLELLPAGNTQPRGISVVLRAWRELCGKTSDKALTKLLSQPSQGAAVLDLTSLLFSLESDSGLGQQQPIYAANICFQREKSWGRQQHAVGNTKKIPGTSTVAVVQCKHCYIVYAKPWENASTTGTL